MTTRAVGALAAALLLLVAAAPAQAVPQRIPGDPLEVWAGDDGNLQARFVANPTTTSEALPTAGFFFPPNSSPGNAGFWLRFANGPAANTTHGGNVGTDFVPVSNGPVTGNFTPMSPAQIETVYEARQGATPVARVRQITRYTNTQRQFRVTWIVANLVNEPLRFRAGFGSDLYVDANDSGTGIFIDGPQRFVGGTNTSSRIAGGALEVPGSRLTNESADTPIPPWTGFQARSYTSTVNAGGTAQGCSPIIIEPNRVDNGLCFQWEDRMGDGNGLPNQFISGQTARYEVIFQVRRPTPIRMSPIAASRELPAQMRLVGRVVDRNENGVPGERVVFQRTGAHPTLDAVTTGPDGNFEIVWSGQNAGQDTVTAWVELGTPNGTRESTEPAVTSTVRWYASNNIDGPPEIGNGTRADGRPLEATSQSGEGGEPDSAYLNVRRGQFGSDAPRCGNGNAGYVASLPVTVNINPGSGTLVGEPRLFSQSPSAGPPTETSGGGITGTQNGNRHTFTLPCVERSDLYVRYTLDEPGRRVQQTFVIPVGQITLIDPQGVVYNRAVFDARRAAGDSEAAARAAAAITGATVVLQRRGSDGQFRRVLSGDPGIAPNINPQITRGNGLYQWDVEAGTWRVVVSAPGCVTQESRAVDIPPPVLDLHIGMDCGGAPPSGGAPAATPAGPPRAAPRPGPAVAARVVRARYDRRRGLLVVTMLAPAPGEVRGVATARRRGTRFLALQRGRRPRTRTIRVGSRRLVVRRAGRVVVSMRLSRAVRRARRARVRYALTFRPRSGGRAQVLRGAITVRAARRARRQR